MFRDTIIRLSTLLLTILSLSACTGMAQKNSIKGIKALSGPTQITLDHTVLPLVQGWPLLLIHKSGDRFLLPVNENQGRGLITFVEPGTIKLSGKHFFEFNIYRFNTQINLNNHFDSFKQTMKQGSLAEDIVHHEGSTDQSNYFLLNGSLPATQKKFAEAYAIITNQQHDCQAIFMLTYGAKYPRQVRKSTLVEDSKRFREILSRAYENDTFKNFICKDS